MLASRTYQPLDDLDENTNGVVVAFGTTPIALRAEAHGATRKPLETTRATLLAMATEPDTDIVMFVARDPDTKQPTEGMAQIQNLLSTKGIPFRVVSSPFPARICTLLTEFNERVEKSIRTVDGPAGQRKRILTEKVFALATQMVDECRLYEQKLADGFSFGVGDEQLDAKWVNWLRIYESLSEALAHAKVVLT